MEDNSKKEEINLLTSSDSRGGKMKRRDGQDVKRNKMFGAVPKSEREREGD